MVGGAGSRQARGERVPDGRAPLPLVSVIALG